MKNQATLQAEYTAVRAELTAAERQLQELCSRDEPAKASEVDAAVLKFTAARRRAATAYSDLIASLKVDRSGRVLEAPELDEVER